MTADRSRRLTTSRWEQAVNPRSQAGHRLSEEDRLAIALHDFAAVTTEDFVPFDYCDGPNGVRGQQGATAFPSTLALAASFDRDHALRLHRFSLPVARTRAVGFPSPSPPTNRQLRFKIVSSIPGSTVSRLTPRNSSLATAGITVGASSPRTRSGIGWATRHSTLMIFRSK